MEILSGDKPLEHPKDDRLSYAPFSEHLASSIYNLTHPEGLVIALYGSWGNGKTTLLNFIKHYINNLPNYKRPIIVDFHPWWFSGREDLTRHFFERLRLILRKNEVIAENIAKEISELAELLSETHYGSIIVNLLKRLPVLNKIFRLRDIPELKNEIARALENQKRRILVVIDDLDRLSAGEIREIFGLIKSVADFPNVIYLVSFDKDVVVTALEDVQGTPGEAYLEKIVQIPFELPTPDKPMLRQLLLAKLDNLLGKSDEELFDQTHWGNIYFEGIDHFINSPRDIVRLINTISVTYPAVEGEVNPIDFTAIETLRVFAPEVYDSIRNNPDKFTDLQTSGLYDSRDDYLKEFHERLIEDIENKDKLAIKSMLIRLFPKVRSSFENIGYSHSILSEWRRKRRICCSDIFPVYFRLNIPEGDIAHSEMKYLISLTNDSEAFSKELETLSMQKRPDGTTRARSFLENLLDYTDEIIPEENIEQIIKALFNVGDKLLLPEDERVGFFDVGNNIRIGRIVWRLLRRLKEQERYKLLKNVMSKGDAISVIESEVVTLGQQHGKYGAKEKGDIEKIVTKKHQENLEKILLERIREFAQNNELIKAPKLPGILYTWRKLADDKEVKEWFGEAIEDDSNLITIIEKFLSVSYTQGMSDVVATKLYRFDPKNIEPFIEPKKIISRVKLLADSPKLSENQKRAIDQFIKEYEIHERGEDPGEFF